MKAIVKLFQTDMPSSAGSNLIIPKEVAEKAIEEFRARLKNGEVYGTFRYDSDSPATEVSHRIDDLFMDSDGVVFMKLETLNTLDGQILGKIINQDITRLMPEMIGTMEELKFKKVKEFHFTRNLYPPKFKND